MNDNYTQCDSLFTILDTFRKYIIQNNLSINQKIDNKINIIYNLKYNNFLILQNNDDSTNVINKLQSIIAQYNIINTNEYAYAYANANKNKNNRYNKNKKNDSTCILYHLNNINNILGNIINNCFMYSGFHVIFNNIPEYGLTLDNNISLDKIDCFSINDSIEHYINNSVIHVVQLSNKMYLVKFNLVSDANIICNLLNNAYINKIKIDVTFIKQHDISENICSTLPNNLGDNTLYNIISIKILNYVHYIYNVYSYIKNILSYYGDTVIKYIYRNKQDKKDK